MAGHSRSSSRCSDDIWAFRLSLKSIVGLNACWTAHCIAPHHCSGLIRKNCFREFYSWLEDIRVYAFRGWRETSSAQSSYFQRCLYYRQEMVHCTIYACTDIDKRSSHSLVLMSQVKAVNTIGDYRSLRHHFTQCVWSD